VHLPVVLAPHVRASHTVAHSSYALRDGTTKILISTDVLSRGFDVTQARLGWKGWMLPSSAGNGFLLLVSTDHATRTMPCCQPVNPI